MYRQTGVRNLKHFCSAIYSHANKHTMSRATRNWSTYKHIYVCEQLELCGLVWGMDVDINKHFYFKAVDAILLMCHVPVLTSNG